MQLQKIFFMVLVLLGLGTGGYFAIRATGALFDYIVLKESADARVLRWEIKEMKGKFPLTASYSFEAKGAVWQGVTRLGEPWHLSEGAAVSALKGKAKEKWTVWFNPDYPEHSTLERSFPTGFILRTVIAFAVVGYFIIIFRRFCKNKYN